MSALLGVVVAAVLGALLAFGGTVALVSSQTSDPSDPIESPLVSYGSQT
jgi:hypothetical protein